MENSSVYDFLSQVPSWDWTAQCIQRLIVTNDSVRFVGAEGYPMQQYVNGSTWGIDLATCLSHCNSTVIPMNFQFQSFAAAFTNYLLPWLGLIAQLPTETGNKNDGIISLCLAVGSPALVTYSLMLTIRNRYWVRQEFRNLRRNIGDVHARYEEFDQRLGAIQYVLEEAQQVPLRLSQEQGWFSSLMVAPQNDRWWKHLRDKLRDTRRGITLSLITQMAVAIVAWLFTIIAAFASSLGNITTALQISAGSIWIWMIPIIAGWIGVGTQQLANSIDAALEIENASLALSRTGQLHGQSNVKTYSQSRNQRGLVVADKDESGLTPYISRTSKLDPGDSYRISSFYNMRGDEKRRGPIFNFARVFTYCHLVGTVHHTLRTMMENIRNRHPCIGRTGTWSEEKTHNTELCGDASQTEAYCGLDQRNIYAYPEWSEIPGHIWFGLVLSIVLSLFLQWGTTGAAIMIAYLTPTKGLGCRSGGYLVYGINATVSWILLAISSLFSHSAMLRYQREKQESTPNVSGSAMTPLDINDETAEPTNGFNEAISMGRIRHASNTSFTTSPRSRLTHRTLWDSVPVRGLAAMTRYAGKTLAVLNAMYLIAISMFEFTGGFNTCWCKSDALGLGEKGWVVLFKTAIDLKQAASLPWGAGVALSVAVCLVSFGIFWGGM